MSATVEDIINLALDETGYPHHIADIYEGSPAARVGLEIYGQTRDELLRARDWSFSRRAVSLSLLKGPPPAGGYNPVQPWSAINPYPGFLYEYSYPSDCLDLRAIVGAPGPMPDLDPLPAEWRVDNDPLPIVTGTPPVAGGPAAKVILCNTTNAMAIYRARVTDMTTWEPLFTQTLVDALAVKFRKAFGMELNAEREAVAESAGAAQGAAGVRG